MLPGLAEEILVESIASRFIMPRSKRYFLNDSFLWMITDSGRFFFRPRPIECVVSIHNRPPVQYLSL